MRWAFRVLGLPHDADERAIKRAYAARLKLARPDEDADAFQRLNEAYRAALAFAAQRRAFAGTDASVDDVIDNSDDGSDEGADAEALVEATPDLAGTETSQVDASMSEASQRTEDAGRPAPPPLPPLQSETPLQPETPEDVSERMSEGAREDGAVSLDDFLDACLEAATLGDPRELERWLLSQPALWSLEHKAAIGHWLLQRMAAQRPPMPERNFDQIARFFGYNDLGSGYDPLMLMGLRDQSDAAWRQWRSEQRQQRWIDAQTQAQAQMSGPQQRAPGGPLPPSAFSFNSYARKRPTQGRDPGEVDWNEIMSRPEPPRDRRPSGSGEGSLLPRWLVFILILMLIRCAGYFRDHGDGSPSSGNGLRIETAPLVIERGLA
ncbi:MAG: hypothetical protein ACOY82_14100 [Pseudomonadota bacterium]